MSPTWPALQDRARLFGLIGSAFSFGFVAGPALGGLLGEISLRAPFIAAALLTLANALYGYFIVPESLPPERRTTRFEVRKANPLGSLTLLRSHRDLFGLAGIFFLNQLAQMIWPAIFVLYTGYRYHWSPLTIGVVMMAGGLIGVGVQSFLVGPCVRRFGERGTLLIGLSFATVAFAYYSWAPTGLVLPAVHAVQLALRPDHAGAAGPDDPPCRRQRAGPAAGREPVHGRHRLAGRPERLRLLLRLGGAQPAVPRARRLARHRRGHHRALPASHLPNAKSSRTRLVARGCRPLASQ